MLDKNGPSIYKNTLHLSREDLANTIGIATESLIRTLTEFKSEGLIDIEKGKVVVLEKNLLRNLSYQIIPNNNQEAVMKSSEKP